MNTVQPIIKKVNVDLVVKADDAAVGVADAFEELSIGEIFSDKQSETFESLVKTPRLRMLRAMLELKAAANGIAGIIFQGALAQSAE